MAFKVKRYHDISCGHRVVGHEGKCRFLHGHNYRVHFECAADITNDPDPERLCTSLQDIELDQVGRVVDFSVIKSKLCEWLEDNWDHRFLFYESDPVFHCLNFAVDRYNVESAWDQEQNIFLGSLVIVPFNPTAENMAQYLVDIIGPKQLQGTGVKLVKVTIEETAKCHASFEV